MSRTEASIKNTAASFVIQAGTILLNFISRTVLIKTMGEQYLGINGLFGNILSMLSLAELGIGTTITYWLYEPMAKNDEKRINALMSIYSKIYNTLGCIILIAGIAIAPFLDFFMKETPDIPHITFIYILYVVHMAMSYFIVYKSTLINVAQKNYIVNSIKFIISIATIIIQIIILLLFQNYVLYYFCSIVSVLLGNIVVSVKAEKMFPFLNTSVKAKLTKEEKKELTKDISAIFSHNIGSFVLSSTDNIIISKFIGVIQVGLYSNYTMILHAVQKFLDLIFASLTSSIGNLLNSTSKDKSYEIFKNIFFATCWLVGFCAVCLYILFNPFITLWLGERYVFDNYVVFFIVLNFYLTFVRRPANTFKHCAGLFRNDRYKPFIESVINLVTSIWLAEKLGIGGVFMGTAISTITACLYVEPYILYKHFYKRSVLEYFKLLFKYMFVTILAVVVIEFLSVPMKETTVLNFLYQMLLCITIPNILFYVFFQKTSEMQYFKDIVLKVFNKFVAIKQRR